MRQPSGTLSEWLFMIVLSVQQLRKAFGGIQAVHNVSFDLAAGELLALIGPNGAGKTTCFNMLNGQIKPDAGKIQLFPKSGVDPYPSRELTDRSPRQIWRLGVGRTFQIAAIFPSMTVRENVQMVFLARDHRLRSLVPLARRLYRTEAMEQLDQVGLADQAQRLCGILAYGDLKRVELAMALASNPQVLLMDEPTAGMSAAERTGLMDLTLKLAKQREIGVLFTEHDMDVVFGYADRVMVMAQGQMIAMGSPAQVQQDPQVQRVYLGNGDASWKSSTLIS